MASTDLDIAVALERLEAIDPDIRAFVDETNRRGRLETMAPAEGPLLGLPIGVKDLYRVDGLPTRGGSRLPPFIFEGEESLASLHPLRILATQDERPADPAGGPPLR